MEHFPPKPQRCKKKVSSVDDRRSVISTLSNGDTIRVLYKNSQLEEGIYPNLIRTLQEGGFQAEGDLWDLLCTVDTLCLALILVCLAASSEYSCYPKVP